MSEEYWKGQKTAEEFERYWNVQNKDSLKRRWGLVQSLQLEPPKSLLDIGCGIGNLITFTTLATEENYLGIDISQPMVERARALHPGYRFEVKDPMKFHNVSDLVVAHGFLLHQHDLFLKLHFLKELTKHHLIFDVLVASEGYSRRSPEGYWTRVLGDEEYGFMKKDLEEEFTLKEVKFGEWSGHREYYLSCRRV
jgi:SAM-dependent methyltransferase